MDVRRVSGDVVLRVWQAPCYVHRTVGAGQVSTGCPGLGVIGTGDPVLNTKVEGIRVVPRSDMFRTGCPTGHSCGSQPCVIRPGRPTPLVAAARVGVIARSISRMRNMRWAAVGLPRPVQRKHRLSHGKEGRRSASSWPVRSPASAPGLG